MGAGPTNTETTRNILDRALYFDIGTPYATTGKVYGDPDVYPQPESYNSSVNICGLRGCHDEPKRFGEILTVAYHREYHLIVRIVKTFNIYTPRMRVNGGRVIPNFVSQALRGDDLII